MSTRDASDLSVLGPFDGLGGTVDVPLRAAAPALDARIARARLLRRIRVIETPSRSYFIAKAVIDYTFAIVAAVALLPVLALIALAIKIDDGGPVLFRQQRTGRGGRRFTMYKFRTMCTNADELKAQLQHLSLVAYPDFKMEKDPRITRVGRVLRPSFLDELPQIVNVLKGDMSLVGPRPTSFSSATYDLWHTERLDAKPGITGYWQISRSAGETRFDDRLRLDVEYLRTRSTLGDLKILAQTALGPLRRSGK